jgi:hypothetical protein
MATALKKITIGHLKNSCTALKEYYLRFGRKPFDDLMVNGSTTFQRECM